ncbi:MAG: zf-HC2 domain-containing protein [Planctomycetota bacterium]|jgi:hypothetical protein|nr:zf-HC2 domain-containing protein [Planctomycetota bacterium]
MNCKQIEPILSRHADGETTRSEAEIVRKHLVQCSHCEDRFREFQTAGFMLQQFYDDLNAPEGVADQILDRAREQLFQEACKPSIFDTIDPVVRHLSQHRQKWLASIAALLLVALLVQWFAVPPAQTLSEGHISYVKGQVTRQLPGADVWSQFSGSGFLLPGGALKVLEGGKARVDFIGQGSILLNEGSTLKLEHSSYTNGLVAQLNQGEAFLDLVSSPSGFVLRTPAGNVTGNGAAANVKIISEEEIHEVWRPRFHLLPSAYAATNVKVVVTAKTGLVKVRTERGEASVYAGTQMTLIPGNVPGPSVPANIGKSIAWTEIETQVAAHQQAIAEPIDAAPEPDTEIANATAPMPEVTPEVEPVLPAEEEEPALNLYPPVILQALPEVGKVTIKWVDDGATTREVAGYDIFRMAVDPDSQPEKINDELIPSLLLEGGTRGGVYVDTTVNGNQKYAYHVKAFASLEDSVPEATSRSGLLESSASAAKEVKASQDFTVTLTGWSSKPESIAHMLVQKWHQGRYVGHVFSVKAGDSIGSSLRVLVQSEEGVKRQKVDFTTGFILVDLKKGRRIVKGGKLRENATAVTLPTLTAVLLTPGGKEIECSRRP